MFKLHLQYPRNDVQEIDIDPLPFIGAGILDVPRCIFDVADAHQAAVS